MNKDLQRSNLSHKKIKTFKKFNKNDERLIIYST